MLPAWSRTWIATRYVPGDTGRPVSVCPDQRHSVAPSSSGTGGPTWRTGPGPVLNRRIFFFWPGANEVDDRLAAAGDRQQLGPRHGVLRRADRRHPRPRRRRVEPHRLRDDDVAALVGERDPVAVVAVGDAVAVVVRPVPARADLAVGQERVVVDEVSTSSPSASTTASDTRPRLRISKRTVARSKRPSWLGEKNGVRRNSPTTDGRRLEALGDEERAERRERRARRTRTPETRLTRSPGSRCRSPARRRCGRRSRRRARGG